MQIKPLVKGAITGVLITIVTLILFYSKLPPTSGWNYLPYFFYAAGIGWTLWDYSRSAEFKPSFGPIFGQGFKCFIIVTLIGAIFVGIFSAMHPEIAEEGAKLYREELVKQKEKTPQQIDEIVEQAKKGFVTSNMYFAIFGKIITGAFFTAVGAGIVLMRNQSTNSKSMFINQDKP